MSVPVAHRISLDVAGGASVAARFEAPHAEAQALAHRLGACVDAAVARVRVDVGEHPATSAQAMVEALLASLPSVNVSLAEQVARDQLVNVGLKLDFCVAMECDAADRVPRLGEVLARFQRTGAQEGADTCRVTMTDPAADQDTDALVGLFARTLGSVLVAHGHAGGLSVTQVAAAVPVRTAEAAVAWLAGALDAAGLPDDAGRVAAALPDDETGTALAA